MSRRALGTVLVLPVLVAAAAAAVPVPTVSGPITGPGAPFVASTTFDVTSLGYVEEEFFLSGTATRYTSATPLGTDGRWTAVPAATAPYRTRILVRRPAERKRFNGTVVVEWLNVSAGLDAGPDWTFAHTMLMREGFAWVGVSAQVAGIEGLGGGLLNLDLSLKTVNPARYGSLAHPGDSFAYDIFAQAGAALRAADGLRPLGSLIVRRLLAIGESQSAFRLVTYVNAIQPLAGVYDAVLIHSRGGGAAALSQPPGPPVDAPLGSRVRRDSDVPVLTLQTETDLFTLRSLPARQPDSRRFRLWEVAGTAHADLYQLLVGMTDRGPAAADTTHRAPVATPIPGIISCGTPVNAGPQHYVVASALARLDRWARGGRPPRRARRLEIAGNAFVLDVHGNVRGGVRTPQLDVPVATLSGLGQTGSGFCALFGTTTPFDPAKLGALYPSHARYVAAVRRAARRAVRAGFLLPLDAGAIVAAAAASDVGS
jgi:hypothetical protein